MVTGGGSGIGRCIAHELAALGAHAVLIGRKLEKLHETAGEIVADGGRASFHACDIRDEEAVKNTVQAIIAVHGRIDALVNNAGGQYITPLENISAKGWEAVVNTNLTGGFLVARECYLQSMQAARRRHRQHRGRHLGFHAEHGPQRRRARRHGELHRNRGGRVGAQRRSRERGRARLHRLQRHGPLSAGGGAPCCARCARPCRSGRFGTEAETSAAVVFLLSPAAAFISGDVLRVDGARPQVRMGWPMQMPDEEAQQRDAVKPFDGFHRAVAPKVFRS